MFAYDYRIEAYTASKDEGEACYRFTEYPALTQLCEDRYSAELLLTSIYNGRHRIMDGKQAVHIVATKISSGRVVADRCETRRQLLRECSECGGYYDDAHAVAIREEYGVLSICKDCAGDMDGYTRCEECGCYCDEDATHEIDGENVCEHCLHNRTAHCEQCGELHLISKMNGTRYAYVCEHCFNDEYVICDSCGYAVHTDDARYSERSGEWYCDDCRDDDDASEYVQPYGYEPDYTVYDVGAAERTDKGRMTLGVELETDDGAPREAAEALRAFDPMIYLKTDGSLSSVGIEIITHPLTLDYHIIKFPWADVCDASARAGYASHNAGESCGLHVHIGRDYFEDDELAAAKMMVFFDLHWDELVKFSRRRIDDAEEWSDRPGARIEEGDDEDTAKEKYRDQRSCGRYYAVNVTNSNTIEIRLWRGTLKASTLRATIAFTGAIAAYCEHTALGDMFDTWENALASVMKYVHDDARADLTAYLEKKNLI